MLNLLTQTASQLERGVRLIGWWAAWLNVVLFITILIQVVLRYLVSGGHQIILGELEWHFYATALMIGLSYSQVYNAHVRVDAMSRRFSPRTRSIIEILGISVLMYPFLIVMFIQGLDYVAVAWRVNEGSDSPVGLPYRWLIKSVIPLAMGLLFLALTARLLREVAFLAGAAVLPQYRERFGRFREQPIGESGETPQELHESEAAAAAHPPPGERDGH